MRETYTKVTDDLTGREDNTAAKRKITLDGKAYEVDLSESSTEALVKFLTREGTADLIHALGTDAAAGKPRSRAGSRRAATASGTGIKLPDGRRVPREDYASWATAHNLKVTPGRQPADTLAAYAKAHPVGSRPAVTTPAAGTVPPAPGHAA